jgi:hypothetical protein
MTTKINVPPGMRVERDGEPRQELPRRTFLMNAMREVTAA